MDMEKNDIMVVGFPVEDYNLDYLQALTDHQKHELALEDCNCMLSDTIEDYFNELNDNTIDTENMYWFPITH